MITAKVSTGSSGTVMVATPAGNASINGFVFVPVPSIVASGPLKFFTTDSLTLSASPSSGYTYRWYNGGDAISGATNPSYIVHQSGSYSVTITSGAVSQTSPRVVADAVFALPANNFSVTATSATCRGSADGVINITAAQSLNYTAAITGGGVNTSYPFTTTLAINSLAAGTYHVCITVKGQSGYQQCYDLVVIEPKDLLVYSTVNSGNSSVTLNLSGADEYNIRLNGLPYITTKEQTVTIPLIDGGNDIVVSTDKLCQGSTEKLINVSGKTPPYPNPFQNTLYLNVTKVNGSDIRVEMHDISDGKLIYAKSFPAQAGVLQLDVSGLDNGVYVLHLLSGNSESVFKVLKK